MICHMKAIKIIFISSLLLCLQGKVYGQSAEEFHQMGIKKASNRNFNGAMLDYNKAVEKDSMLLQARSDRAAAEFALKDFTAALADYTYIIKKDPKDENAIYNHAVCRAALNNRKGAVASIDHLIALNPNSGAAWLFRAQMQQSMGNTDTACKDFQKAYDLRERTAGQFLQSICGRKDVLREDYLLPWDSAAGWRGVVRENNEKEVTREILMKGESMENFKVAAAEVIYKEKAVPLRTFMQKMINENKRICPGGKFEVLEYDTSTPYPYIIFTLECPKYTNSPKPQSQLIKVIQGKVNTYLIAIISSSPGLTREFINNWYAFLKLGKIEER